MIYILGPCEEPWPSSHLLLGNPQLNGVVKGESNQYCKSTENNPSHDLVSHCLVVEATEELCHTSGHLLRRRVMVVCCLAGLYHVLGCTSATSQ